MYTRLDKIPTLQTRTDNLDARFFNSVRLGLIRYGAPLRLELAGLRGMDIILERERWACVDRTLFDLPVIAWDRFESIRDADRPQSLLQSIRCRVRHYHCNANHISAIVLAATVSAIGDRFEQDRPRSSAAVLRPFPTARISDAMIRAALAKDHQDDERDDEIAPSDSSPVSG